MSRDINMVSLTGRLTKDLGDDVREYGFTQSNVARANISVAVNDTKKGADGKYTDLPSYVNVQIWGKQAESLRPYLRKGQAIAVDGKLRQDRWKDKQTGQTRSTLYVVADSVKLLGGTGGGNRQEHGGQNRGGGGMRPATNGGMRQAPQQAPQQQGGYDGYGDYGGYEEYPEF